MSPLKVSSESNLHQPPGMKQFILTMMLFTSAISSGPAAGDTTPPFERYRPQFHFTAQRNWINDPNGCVFHDGEHHLFFQHNPFGNEWGNMTWGHAVSRDLLHWQQLPNAIEPYGGGTIFSGSAVVDAANTAGFAQHREKPLIAFFTHATKPSGQAMAVSLDKGRTFTLYEGGKHVVPNQGLDECERDPKVFWHRPTGKWVMVLWVKRGVMRFFTSGNLKDWEFASDFESPELFECPDLFEANVDGNPESRRWILYDAAFNYWIGSFDGRSFTPEAGPYRGDYGANFYAAQTWNNLPDRVVQIAWMRDGKYPGMPFNQQMSFPCELQLRTTSDGLRLCRWPVKEIESLHGELIQFSSVTVGPELDQRPGAHHDLFDIEMAVLPGSATEFGLRFHEFAVTWSNNEVSCAGSTAPLAVKDGKIALRLLLDRTSVEVFGNGGEVSITSCILPKNETTDVEPYAKGGNVQINLAVRKLRSALPAIGSKARKQ